MSSFWQDLAIAYRPAAVSRRKQIALRLFVVLVLAAMAMIRPGAGFIFPWAAVYLVVQIAEWAALNRFLRKLQRIADEHGVAVVITNQVGGGGLLFQHNLSQLVISLSFGGLVIS